jgi:cobalt-zinc-cadmium efflux system membrane fusion protein
MTNQERNGCVRSAGVRRLALSWLLLGFILPLAFESAACGSRGREVSAATHESESARPTLFTVPESQLKHLQIKPVQKETWATTVHTTGTVDWDADHTTQAITQVSGPITKILVDTGSLVKEEDPLLYVASPDITNAIAAYRKAKNRMDFEERTLERSKDLLAHRAIAQKDYESVQADYYDASTDLQNALQALRIFGITANEIAEAQRQGVAINPQLAVRSPISGMVVQKLVFPGQLIQAGATTCFAITDVSRVWVQGHVYEKDLTSVRVGDPVEETNSALPGVFHGVISYIGAMVDPATRTTPVRMVTNNPNGLLKKDLFVDAVIQTRTQKNLLTVPTSAILYDPDNMPFVYVQMDGSQFAQRMVTIGAQQNNKFEIVSGLEEGEKVVTEGSVFLQFANTYQR